MARANVRLPVGLCGPDTPSQMECEGLTVADALADCIIRQPRLKARIFRLMDQAFSLFDVLAVIALLVASLGIFNTLTMNVLERTREIGMLRAIGMGGRQVLLMILSEAGLMGLIGGGLGLALGLVLSRIFFISMNAMSARTRSTSTPT